MHSVPRAQIRLAYADYLHSLDWDYFATVTFRHQRHDPIAAVRDVDELVAPFSTRRFWAVEPHRTGALHLHGLVKLTDNPYEAPPGEDERYQAYYERSQCQGLWHGLFHRFGRTRVSFIDDDAAVTNYCSKYVTKDAAYEYEFCGDASAWRSARA